MSEKVGWWTLLCEFNAIIEQMTEVYQQKKKPSR